MWYFNDDDDESEGGSEDSSNELEYDEEDKDEYEILKDEED